MTTRSEEEANSLLEATRKRVIDMGYQVAVELATKHGFVHSQMVLEEMDKRGQLPSSKSFRRNWTSVIFKGSKYKDTWVRSGMAKIGDSDRNVHAALRVVWKLRSADEPTSSKPSRGEIKKFLDDVVSAVSVAKQHGWEPINGKASGCVMRHLSKLVRREL